MQPDLSTPTSRELNRIAHVAEYCYGHVLTKDEQIAVWCMCRVDADRKPDLSHLHPRERSTFLADLRLIARGHLEIWSYA
jgi:hypothetical protein